MTILESNQALNIRIKCSIVAEAPAVSVAAAAVVVVVVE
jgi:hypothetical protein